MASRLVGSSTIITVLAAVLGLGGCTTKFGARSLPDVRRSYNDAVAQSADEQMLLNVVRLRHLHTTSFLQLSSVVTQYSIGTSAGASATGNVGTSSFAPPGSFTGTAGVSANERPTVTYVPLQGEEFVRRMATPLRSDGVALLIHAGWGWDLVMACCVRQINDVYAPPASSRDLDNTFANLGATMAALQWRHEVEVHVDARGDGVAHLSFRRQPDGSFSPEAKTVRNILGLGSDVNTVKISDDVIARPGGTVAIRGRSLLGALFYLSQGVDVPQSDSGARVLGDEYTPRLPWLRVANATRPPKSAYVGVPYQDRWYYINDTDQETKRMFALLGFLFSFMSSPQAAGPVLTVPAGG